MPRSAPTFKPRKTTAKQFEPNRQERKERKSLYDRKWRKARDLFLQENPLCVDHQKQGFIVAAVIVDHIIPHKGDRELFWDQSNWQSLCKTCHDTKTATQDGGFGRKVASNPA